MDQLKELVFPLWFFDPENVGGHSDFFVDIENAGLSVEWRNTDHEIMGGSVESSYLILDNLCRPVFMKMEFGEVLEWYLEDVEPMEEHVDKVNILREKYKKRLDEFGF